jgi:uncharacterized protein with GYD domain
MYQASYTSEAVAALIREPQDRAEAARTAIEAVGGKIVAVGYPFGEYDVVIVFEALDETAAASVPLAAAGGAVIKASKTNRMLSGPEWIESLRKAQEVPYRPPQ